MASWNFFPEGMITPMQQRTDEELPHSLSRNGCSKRIQKGKKRQIPDSLRNTPPPVFKTTIGEIHKIMQTNKALSETSVTKVKELLDTCYMDDPVCTYPDEYGYDIVQRAAALDAITILEHLVNNGYSLCLNTRSCSSALYLACKNHNIAMVKYLLKQGASIHHSSKSCYPKRHNMEFTRRRGSSGESRVVCSFPNYDMQIARFRPHLNVKEYKATPLYTAIKHDNHEILEILLQHEIESESCDGATLLEFACKVGAVHCFRILIQMCARHFRNDNNKASQQRPLLPIIEEAFAHSETCGLVFFEETCSSGIKEQLLQASCPMTKWNILHLVYSKPVIHYFDITKKIILAGFNTKNINQTDSLGNSPLHILVSQLGPKSYTGSVLSSSARNTNGTSDADYFRIEEERQEQLFATVQYLVNLGADINMQTKFEETVLHKLIDTISLRRLGNCSESSYESLVLKIQPKMNRLLEYFLRKGVDVNYGGSNVSTVLSQLINTLSTFVASSLDAVWVHMWYTFNLLFKYNADPNIIDSRGISAVSMALTTLHRWLQLCSSQSDDDTDSDLPCRVLEKVKDLVWLMFQNGLQPSNDVLQLSIKQINIICNINIRNELFLTMVKHLLVPFFSHGINPNKLDIVYDGENNIEVPCRLHAQFYLTRTFIIHSNESDAVLQFFEVFLHTLEQESLNVLLRGIQRTLEQNFESALQQQVSCLKLVESLKQNVRSLKCLSRISIANSLQWKIYEKKAFLPLPKSIQQYLCDL